VFDASYYVSANPVIAAAVQNGTLPGDEMSLFLNYLTCGIPAGLNGSSSFSFAYFEARPVVLQKAVISVPIERTPCLHGLASVFQHTLRGQGIKVSSPCAVVFLKESFQSFRYEVTLAGLPQTANVVLQHTLYFRIGGPEYALVIHAVGVAVYVGVRLDAIRRKVRAACQ